MRRNLLQVWFIGPRERARKRRRRERDGEPRARAGKSLTLRRKKKRRRRRRRRRRRMRREGKRERERQAAGERGNAACIYTYLLHVVLARAGSCATTSPRSCPRHFRCFQSFSPRVIHLALPPRAYTTSINNEHTTTTTTGLLSMRVRGTRRFPRVLIYAFNNRC